MAESGGRKSTSGAVTQPLQNYLDRRQATGAEWVDLQPIFDVCTREMVYEGGGKLWVPWWRQVAAEKQPRVRLEDILSAARERRQWKYGRSGEGEEGMGEEIMVSSG